MVFGLRSRKADGTPVSLGVDPVGDGSPDPNDLAEKKPAEPVQLTDEQAARRLRLFREAAANDPNINVDDLGAVDNAVGGHDVNKENQLVDELVENSPYPEVRAAVRNYDVDLPANTVRAWFIGMLMTTVFSAMNMLFSLRQPSITITSYVAQLVAYPIGIGMARVLPNRQYRVFGLKFNLNPGPFNFKEHGLIVLMANASYGGGAGYFTDILTAQKAFYGFDLGVGYAILLGLTSQCIGFGMAGLVRIWLVEPASMIWPQNLVNVAFMYTLHDRSVTDPAKTNGWTISRYRWFFYIFVGAFCWYWIPGFLFQALSVFVFPTFIAPNNVTINKLFGGWTGMALLPITFDWTQIAGYVSSPLIPPWHAIANTLIGMVVFFWITSAGIHWTNTWYADWLPFSDPTSWDNTQHTYNVSRILTPENTLDLAKYKEYSPIFLSTTFAMAYGLSFAGIISLIFHAGLFHSKEIWMRWRDKEHALDDVHAKMMRKYKPVPQWWFLCVFLPMFALCFVTSYVWDTGLTWWAIILAMVIALVWLIPIGIVQAITNIQLGLNVFTEFIIGYMLPGRPTAMMMFKTYGYITMSQGLAFVADMKLGHYLKLPPRTMFFGQVIATIWSTFVQVAVFYWSMSGAIKDVCTDKAAAHFTCPNGSVFFTASILWGLIGPARIFSGTGIYKNLQYFWIIGAALPTSFWLIRKRWPNSIVRYLNAPVIFSGTGSIPPATPLNYLSWGIVGFIFNKWIRDRWRGWWMRFNYVTSAGLDSGLAISTIIIVLTLSLTNTAAPSWWGNNIGGQTLDSQDAAFNKVLGPGETFGPRTW
ncbi:Sexual differentiation process protein isp4 [Tolypocladium capitatum]|uniref:Sexual differentiation process protein isp4 n=1 Tax=Tolypocladium capitatum TaxID=45235 RepID=A0A2K3QJW6_9HYPO|nr:Sexual differentiation process protein isp4 [Tolypocladium capitatum]